jgi:hypothetical protein
MKCLLDSALLLTSIRLKRVSSQTHRTRWASLVTVCSLPLMMEGALSLNPQLPSSAETHTSTCSPSSSLASQPPILYVAFIGSSQRNMTKTHNHQFNMMIKRLRWRLMIKYLINLIMTIMIMIMMMIRSSNNIIITKRRIHNRIQRQSWVLSKILIL